jgi:hypothetical protein
MNIVLKILAFLTLPVVRWYHRRMARQLSIPYRITFHEYNDSWSGGDSDHCGYSPIKIQHRYGNNGKLFPNNFDNGLIPVTIGNTTAGMYRVRRGPFRIKHFNCSFIELEFVKPMSPHKTKSTTFKGNHNECTRH